VKNEAFIGIFVSTLATRTFFGSATCHSTCNDEHAQCLRKYMSNKNSKSVVRDRKNEATSSKQQATSKQHKKCEEAYHQSTLCNNIVN
jgi:hypothetical protein